MGTQWSGSTRRSRLPRDWHRIRAAVLERDGHRCTATLRDDTRCAEPGTDVDHIDRHGGDGLDNLQTLCGWHHRKKTAQEAAEARAAQAPKPTLRRPREQHPGLR